MIKNDVRVRENVTGTSAAWAQPIETGSAKENGNENVNASGKGTETAPGSESNGIGNSTERRIDANGVRVPGVYTR